MNKRIKIVKVSVITLMFTMITGGCTAKKDSDDYYDMNPDLYSIAIHSVLGATGYNLSEVKHASKVTVMESDKVEKQSKSLS